MVESRCRGTSSHVNSPDWPNQGRVNKKIHYQGNCRRKNGSSAGQKTEVDIRCTDRSRSQKCAVIYIDGGDLVLDFPDQDCSEKNKDIAQSGIENAHGFGIKNDLPYSRRRPSDSKYSETTAIVHELTKR